MSKEEVKKNLKKQYSLQVLHEALSKVKTLKQLREESGLTMTQIGEIIGETRQRVFKFEIGRNIPSLGTSQLLAEALGVKVDDIIASTLKSQYSKLLHKIRDK